MWSPVEKTALAEAEVEYEDVVSTQIDVAFEIVEGPNAPELVGAHAVIWTTDAVDDPGEPGVGLWAGGRVRSLPLEDGRRVVGRSFDSRRAPPHPSPRRR
jgi:isoleucyl-tRNA synthetase